MELIRIKPNSNINPIVVDDINANFNLLKELIKSGDNTEILDILSALELSVNELKSNVDILQSKVDKTISDIIELEGKYGSLSDRCDNMLERIQALENPS